MTRLFSNAIMEATASRESRDAKQMCSSRDRHLESSQLADFRLTPGATASVSVLSAGNTLNRAQVSILQDKVIA